MESRENGIQAIDTAIAQLAAEQKTFLLPAGSLRRVARLHARLEGAQGVAQAAINASQQAQSALQAALNEACEDEGLHVPPDGSVPVDIDWRTGRLSLRA
jgi:hypothetical protein